MANINPTPISEPEPRSRQQRLDYLRALITYHIAMKITNMNGLPMILIGMAACIGSAMALYSVVELPLVHLRDQVLYGRRNSRTLITYKSRGKCPSYQTIPTNKRLWH